MSKPNPADLPGSMAILGLLVERPDQTVAEVTESLRERFAGAQFDPATASHTLSRMAREERPRLTCTYQAPGRARREDRYVPSAFGAEEFDCWMRMRPTGVPALREALYGRIELCRGPEDLPELIRMAREESAIANDRFTKTKMDLTYQLEKRRRRKDSPDLLLTEVRNVLLTMTPEYWCARSIHFDEIAQHLEKVARKAGIPFEART